MPNANKVQKVASLNDQVARAKSIVFAKYTGMDVSAQVKLRQAVKNAGGEISVSKNRLVNIALGKKDGLTEMLQEQLFTLFSYEDEVKAVKALTKFISENEKPQIVGGFMEDRVLSAKEVDILSKTPGREELIVKLLQTLKGPAYGLRNVVEAVPGSLVRVLNAIATKQS